MEDRDEMPGRVLAACLLVARGLPVLAVLFVAAMHSSACESLLLALSVSSGIEVPLTFLRDDDTLPTDLGGWVL